jgi:hypothetical protein
MLTISSRFIPSHKVGIHLRKKRVRQLQLKTQSRPVRCNFSNEVNDVIVHNSYLIGKYVGLIVLFTATLNWMSYRRIRKMIEDEENNQPKRKK